jgi:radical SAM protein with 4Fe4S-binding SPASM domain
MKHFINQTTYRKKKMVKASRDFQVFVKPVGALCNLDCVYCYYLEKEHIYPLGESFQMPYDVLEKYITQHIEASPEQIIRFSWHGGEPTLLGLEYFRKITSLQHKHKPPNKTITNGIQTNGTLLDDDWGLFFAQEGFAVGISIDGPKEMHDKYRFTKDHKPTHEQIKIQIFEEAARTAFNQKHSLCIFRPTCGNVPVIEHNGDFFSCDHFVDDEHHLGNIKDVHLVELLESPEQRSFGRAKLEKLPRICRECDVRDMCNGGCPKNRFIMTPDGEQGLNYLCLGYKQFFRHCKPFVSEVASLWRQQKSDKKNKV